MTPLRLLDLFSGIGGFSLGLERSGAFKTVAFCEIAKFPRAVLKYHWPEVPIYEDICQLTAARLTADGIAVDAICGGFPCQDISTAGAGAGLDGARSGLWSEYARLVGELRPCVIIVENVSALLSRGLDRVLGDLASFGYDAEWHCIPASAVGAPHRRDRIWIVAYPSRERRGEAGQLRHHEPEEWVASRSEAMADAYGDNGRQGRSRGPDSGCAGEHQPERSLQDVADAGSLDAQGQFTSVFDPQVWRRSIQRQIGSCRHGNGWWAIEPQVGRVANGVPDRVDRLKSLGNSVVPQIPEMIGRAIAAARQENVA